MKTAPSLVRLILIPALFQSSLFAVKSPQKKDVPRDHRIRPFDASNHCTIELEYDSNEQANEFEKHSKSRNQVVKSYERLMKISLSRIKRALVPEQKNTKYAASINYNIFNYLWAQTKIRSFPPELLSQIAITNRDFLETIWDYKEHELLKDRIELFPLNTPAGEANDLFTIPLSQPDQQL